MALIRHLALGLGILGCLFFASAFVASLIKPGFVEQIAKTVIRYQVEKEVSEKIEAIDTHFVKKRASVLVHGYAQEAAKIKRQLSDKLPEHITAVLAEMQNLDCECRKKIETSIRDGLNFRIRSVSQAQQRLTTLIRSEYMEAANQLTREFRIFTGTNALVFALLIAAVLVKPQARLQLVPVAVVLTIAAVVTAYLYLFNQNWLHTLVFSNYVGFAYVGYLGISFAFLSDVIFNRSRVTARILSQFFNAVGSTVQVVPC